MENYAMDIGHTETKKRNELWSILINTARRNGWGLLGTGNRKRYFRFGYVDDVVDPEYKGESGFYYWTADSMRSDNYQEISLDRTIALLVDIDKEVNSYGFQLGAIKVKVGFTITLLGCKEVYNEDLQKLYGIMYKYDLKFITLEDHKDNITFTWEQMQKINNLINKRRK